MQWRIPLSDPEIGQEEIEAVGEVLRSKWLTMGPVTEEFEKQFAAKHDVRYALAVNNCTAALHMANVALGIGVGDEVICPALTFVASANAIRYTGAEVSFVNVISEEDLTIDPKDVERKITGKTKAITVVHYAGFPCLMDDIMDIARRHGLHVIEDCAHAPLAWHQCKDGSRKYVGAIGDVGCFSFFGNKNMTTGEGGMITTNDEAIASRIKLLRSHGMTTLTYDRHKGHASGYDVVALGYNYRSDELHSALGLCQLNKLDRFNAGRREVYRKYAEILASNENVIVPFLERNINQSACHIMSVIIKKDLDSMRQRLRDAGIQTSRHYDLIPGFTNFRGSGFENHIALLKNLLTLPLYPHLSEKDISYIGSVVNE